MLCPTGSESDIITCDRRKPAQSWDRKLSQDADLKECPCFQRWPPESKRALPGVLKNQYQGQRRPVWGFEVESQEMGKSGGYNKDQSTTRRREKEEGSIIGHGEIHSPREGLDNG